MTTQRKMSKKKKSSKDNSPRRFSLNAFINPSDDISKAYDPNHISTGKIRKGRMLETNLGGVLEPVPGLDQPRILSGPYGFSGNNRMPSKLIPPTNTPNLELAFGEGPAWTKVSDATITPWRSICYLDLVYTNGQTARGTGWFVDETTIITAGHNLFHPSTGWVQGVAIRPGLNQGGTGFNETVYAVEGNVHPTWRASLENNSPSYGHDIAYMKIEEADLGRFLGYFGIRALSDQELAFGNLIVHSAGYPITGWPAGSMWVDATRIGAGSFDQNFIYYRLDTHPGNSGAPIFASFADGSRYVIACHVHGTSDMSSNVGIRITDEIFDLLDNWAS